MDLTPHARRVVELAREQRTPTDQDLERIEARIALGLAATAATAATAVVVAGTAKVGASGKAAAAIAGYKWFAGTALLVTAIASYAARPTAPDASAAARPVAPVAWVAPAPAPAPVLAAPLLPAPAPALAPEALAAKHRPATATRPHRADPDPAADVELLHRAQIAWRERDAQTALSLLREHRARFAGSSLRLERDALQVLTLCALGRKGEAIRLGRGLLARAPRSPLRVSIEESCAVE